MDQTQDNKIWITATYTVQTAPYESLKVEAGFSVTREPGDDPYAIISQETSKLIKQLIIKAENIKDNINNFKG